MVSAAVVAAVRVPAKFVVFVQKSNPLASVVQAVLGKQLPDGAELVGLGGSEEELGLTDEQLASVNAAFHILWPKGQPDAVEALWPKLTSLKWLHSAGAGQEHVLFPALVEGPVVLTNGRGLTALNFAEWVLAAISWFAKDLPRLKAQQKEKKWESFEVEELRGKTLGVIGYGEIGQEVARLARAYGIRVVALRRRTQLTADEVKEGLVEKVYSPGQVKELAAESDYVLISTPWTPATDKILSKEAIAALKPNAVVINVGRGKCIDEEALIDALREKRIRGAALDVTAIEPLPEDSPLWELDNVLISPHSACRTKELLNDLVRFFNKQLERFIAGEELLNVVDKQAGY